MLSSIISIHPSHASGSALVSLPTTSTALLIGCIATATDPSRSIRRFVHLPLGRVGCEPRGLPCMTIPNSTGSITALGERMRAGGRGREVDAALV
jgi:hypothetical protein